MTAPTGKMKALHTGLLSAFLGLAFVLPPADAATGEIDELMASLGLGQPRSEVLAPDFALPNLNGRTTRLSDYRGKLVLLNFMDTNCHWCRKEMPTLQNLYDAFKNENFVITVVFVDRSGISAVAPFMEKTGYTFAADSGLLDPYGAVSGKYLVSGTPTSFLIDGRGRIIALGIGYRDWSRPEARLLIKRLLGLGQPK